ncbi:prepilin-type N-terminal cleavage/methylation domain-containing protein [Paenibacillus sp. CGMCC 1.18879]|uniref:prepilin-type N-terminal cleavage/methylation domain-containing protein n=1 Tax=Paenibacillus sp. CGMCC 1.18879 TaxID=2834466 RepID=UPI00292F53BB|nr:prepilin-type N-terminal cleavage/methylation domain-containing protein [Paenibacillus sp. CGMCC 1.18879]
MLTIERKLAILVPGRYLLIKNILGGKQMLANAIKKRLSKEENQKGFTLIELLAVIVIIGIIAVIAIPLIGNVISNTKSDSDVATARQIYDAARLYITSTDGDFTDRTITVNDADANNSNDLVHAGYLDSNLVLPSTKGAITGGTVTFNPSGQLSGLSLTVTGMDSAKEFDPAEVIAAKPASTK